MEKQNIAYDLESKFLIRIQGTPLRTLNCLIKAIVIIKNNAEKKCNGKRFKARIKGQKTYITVVKNSLTIAYGNEFSYEFLYNKETDSFKVVPSVSYNLDTDAYLPIAHIKTFHVEMQAEIKNNPELVTFIKNVIDCALTPYNPKSQDKGAIK